MMSRRYRKASTTPSYIEPFLVLASAVTRIISISAYACLFGISYRITSSAIGLKIRAIAASISH